VSAGFVEPGSPSGEIFAAQVLAELREVGGETLVRELMAVFAEHTPRRLRSAEQSLTAGDLEGFAATVHSLRSASGTVGARRLADLAGQLERAARAGADADLAAGLEELRQEAEQASTAARRLSTAAS
jgi:HPt (histidine-containing phosphotransfer) domain-containing protein